MGYAIVVGHCFSCGGTMTYNPHKVPSIRVLGERQPICRTCIELANPIRIKNGLPPIKIDPEAYEAIDEREL